MNKTSREDEGSTDLRNSVVVDCGESVGQNLARTLVELLILLAI